MIRCVLLWSSEDGQSHVQVGALRLDRPGESGPSRLSELIPAQVVSFEETPPTQFAGLARRPAPPVRDRRHGSLRDP